MTLGGTGRGFFVASAIALTAGEAVAAPRLVVGRGPAAQDCPDAEHLGRSIRALTPKAPSPTEITAAEFFDVRFERSPDGFHARIEATGEHAGVRELADDGASCATLAEATALAIALIVDPDAAGRPPAPPPPERPPPTPPPPRSVRLEAGAGVAAFVVRPAAPLVHLHGTLAIRPWLALEMGGVFIPTQDLPLERGRVEVRLVAGRANACIFPISSDAFRLGSCGGFIAGALTAGGRGYPTEKTATRPLFGATVDATAGGLLAGPLGWSVRAGVLVPFPPETFAIDGVGVAYEAPPVALVTTIGATLTF